MNGRMPQWLYTVWRNRSLDVKRSESIRRTAGDVNTVALSDSRNDPAGVAERGDSSRWVLCALSELPDNQQEVIRLRFKQELSYKDIAEVTGLSVSNVGFLIHTGIKGIRKRHEGT